MKTIIRKASSQSDLEHAKTLLYAYADWLGVDLCFQGFEEEMATFPTFYKAVYVAEYAGDIVGTIALKHHSNTRCEMKRLYVKPEAHKKGIGLALCNELISTAIKHGYIEMVLDTLERLKPAITLYEKLGFSQTMPYTPNPEEDVVYMCKKL